MELRHLRHFLVLSEELHFARAAQRLRISQSPLSSSIKNLEQDLGVRLFERNSRRVELTRAGNALVPWVREMLSHADDLKNLAHAVDQGRIGRITIGFNEGVIFRGFPEIVNDFSRTAPEVEVALVEKVSSELQGMLSSGRLDGAFVNALAAPPGFSNLVLMTEKFVACMPTSHPLANRKAISLDALKNDTFIMYSPTTSTGEHVIKLCRQAGFIPRTRFVGMRMLSVIGLVSKHFGIAIVPESFRQCQIPNVSFVDLNKGVNNPTSFFIWNPRKESPGLAHFIWTIREHRKRIANKPR